MPPVLLRGELYLAMSIPRRIRKHVPNVGANRSSRLIAFPDIWICDPLKPPPPIMAPGVLWGDLYLAYESADVNHSWCQSVQSFDTFSRLLNVWPPKPQVPPCVSKGNLFGVYSFPDESAHVCQMWCQFVQPFDSFNILLNLWPPKTPQYAPCDIEGRIVFSLCPFPNESADLYQM